MHRPENQYLVHMLSSICQSTKQVITLCNPLNFEAAELCLAMTPTIKSHKDIRKTDLN